MQVSPSPLRSPGKFFLLTVAVSVPVWLVGILARRLAIGLPFGIPISIFTTLCPLIAALILVGRDEGSRGVRRLLKRAFDFGAVRPRAWYLPAILLLPLIYLLSYVVMRLLGRPLPEWEIALVAVPIVIALFFALAVGEEVGWTGYALDPLRDRLNALTAALVLGAMWVAWHLPGDLIAGQSLDWIVWQRLYTIALRVLIVWVYTNAGSALVAAVIFHATDNVSFALFPNMGSHYDPAIIATITTIAAVVVTYLWGAQTLARYKFARPEPFGATSRGS